MDFLSADSLPWLHGAQQRMRDALSGRRLSHSLLLLSVPGLGANWIGAMALCESDAARPCGACASCVLLRADSHPDWHVVRVEEDAQQIKVEQIRELIESLALSSYRGGYKVGIVEGAEALNANGANAFLKTLEEPTDKTLLVMIARPSHRLPATIASRCFRLHLRARRVRGGELARDPAPRGTPLGGGARPDGRRAAVGTGTGEGGSRRDRGGDAGDSAAIELGLDRRDAVGGPLGQVRSHLAADVA